MGGRYGHHGAGLVRHISPGRYGRLLMVRFRAILNFKLGHRRVRYDSLRIPDYCQVLFWFNFHFLYLCLYVPIYRLLLS